MFHRIASKTLRLQDLGTPCSVSEARCRRSRIWNAARGSSMKRSWLFRSGSGACERRRRTPASHSRRLHPHMKIL
ncbi:hypothetical protein MAR_028705 [Mya arenaria]|uniref:Uncharacterized protein n=1 Tax=Mya arenaria TaxID=6604 RepID=A0ABY7DH37_MYAAR|nr:hypothetical protein MAR_028705 [Mya arenaria]